MSYTAPVRTQGMSVVRSTPETAIVTLDEVKAVLALDFETHDLLIQSLIEAATRAVENYCGISLRPTTITVRWACAGNVELPYGPVTAITSVQDADGEDITYTAGLLPGFVELDLQRELPTTITYTAGAETIDPALKMAVIRHAVDGFEGRTGFDMTGRQTAQLLPTHWKQLAKPYRRTTWWA